MFIDGTACNMPNVSKLCTEEAYNLHVSAFKYFLPDLHKSVPPLNHAKLAVTHEFKLIFIQHTVKYQQSLTHMLSLDEIRHKQLPSFCIHNRHQSF